MFKRLLIVAAPVALLAAPATAADVYSPIIGPPAPPPYAPPPPNNWADLTLAAGYEQTIDHFNSCADLAGSVIAGEGRFGMGLGSNMTFQVDVHGTSDQMNGIGCNDGEDDAAVFGAALHFGYTLFARDNPSSIGLMLGAASWQESQRWFTVAGEVVWGIGARSRITLQGGWSFQQPGDDEEQNSPYVHAVLDFAPAPDWLISANFGYAAPNDPDEGRREAVFRYGAKLEKAFNPTVSAFLEWQGIHRIEANDWPDDVTDNNRVLVGFTFRLNNNGNLLSSSPLHDFSWPAGVNNQFEF